MRKLQAKLGSQSVQELSDDPDRTISTEVKVHGPSIEDTASSDMASGYREVKLPQWLKDNKLCNESDWKAFEKCRKTGVKDRFYEHQEYRRKFRSQLDVEIFVERILLEGGDIFDGKKLQKKRVTDDGSQSKGNSTRSSKAICTRGRGTGTSAIYSAADKLPLPNDNYSSRSSNIAICTRGRGNSTVYRAVDKLPLPNGNSSWSSMAIVTRGEGRGTSAVRLAADNQGKPHGFV